MKLLDGGRAPNPRRVRVFLAEKGIEIPIEPIDMSAMEHKGETVTEHNVLQRLPVLILDDGTALTESVAICRYFEELHPQPPLMGAGALDKARVEMWQRRMEMHLLLLVANVFRHAHPAMATWEVPQIKEFSDANRPKVLKTLIWLNDELKNRPFIAGERYTIADITAMIALDFCKPARLEIPQELEQLLDWYERVKSRPSSSA
ncbi:MAG: glutathione S-transferase [Rhizobiaceae bacterium]|nr:glutathione S-transferase [Rhizobiaceae bacterium]